MRRRKGRFVNRGLAAVAMIFFSLMAGLVWAGDGQSHQHQFDNDHLHSQGGDMSGVGETTQQHDHDHDHDHEHAGVEGRVGELIAWLGKFHPLVVHFPIALIVAAAVAEVLLIVTGRSLFDDAGRFCVWLGSLSAVEAGVLGWFLGGFHLVDSEWVMTTHRWLGSLVVLMAVIVLVLRERSRQGGGSGRVWFRVALFMSTAVVAATGFFGGALIYGLDHLAW